MAIVRPLIELLSIIHLHVVVACIRGLMQLNLMCFGVPHIFP